MFANLILGCLESGHQVIGVFRHERVLYDNITLGIKDLIAPSKDKAFINSYKLHEITANSINSEAFRKEALKLNPDIILVGSWSEKICQKTINLPKIGCINCHPSLLPRYRGPNPYAQAIKNGETKTGVTFHLVDSGYDTGPILHQAEVNILPDDTGETLKTRCAITAKTEVMKLLNNLENEIIIPINQNERIASYQKQLCEDDILLDFTKTAIEIDRHIRALTPWLKCYIPYKNKFFQVNDYKIIDNKTDIKTPATIIKKESNSLYITCSDDKIIILENLKLLGDFSTILTKFYINLFLKIYDNVLL